eukprot:5895694-Amphidinium_carterae.1
MQVNGQAVAMLTKAGAGRVMHGTRKNKKSTMTPSTHFGTPFGNHLGIRELQLGVAEQMESSSQTVLADLASCSWGHFHVKCTERMAIDLDCVK